MSAHRVAPGAQAKRFAASLDRLAQAAEHADRATPLKSYCAGLLLPGERKSVEPMAARLYPENVRQAHQLMHHIVADGTHQDWKWHCSILSPEVGKTRSQRADQTTFADARRSPWLV